MEEEIKKDIVLTEDEKKMIEDRRFLGELIVNNEHIKELAIMTDMALDGVDDLIGKINENVHASVVAKKLLDQGTIDVEKGTTEEKALDGRVMTILELRIRNISLQNKIFSYCANIRNALVALIKDMRVKDYDGNDVLSMEQHKRLVDDIKSTLASFHVDLMRNRISYLKR